MRREWAVMARTQITPRAGALYRRTRQRASDPGLSRAAYLRRLVIRDLGPALVFDPDRKE
jgi:hypothetical protein